MPADPSGVTTDDQRPRDNEADDPSPAPTDGRSAPSPTAAASGDGGETGGEGPAATGDADNSAPAPVAPPDPATAKGAPSGDPVPDPGPVGADPPIGATGADGGAGGAAPTGDPGPAAWPDPVPDATAQTTTTAPDATAPTTTIPDPGPDGLTAEDPPPAPVLAGGTAPPGGRRREGRGRHASPRADRASKRGLRVQQRLWSLDVWSVFKISALFYLCLGLIVLVAGTLLYNAGRSVGTIDQAESFVTRMGAYGECVPKAEVEEGAEFEEDEDKCEEGEVLVGGFALDDGTLFRTVAIGGLVLVVAGSIGNVLMTVLLNLLNELTGGLRHTIVKEPVSRPPGSRPARSPSARRRPPTGSPARRPQG